MRPEPARDARVLDLSGRVVRTLMDRPDLLDSITPRRIEAEAVRDNLLYVSGDLDPAFGGPDIDHNRIGIIGRSGGRVWVRLRRHGRHGRVRHRRHRTAGADIQGPQRQHDRVQGWT